MCDVELGGALREPRGNRDGKVLVLWCAPVDFRGVWAII